MSRHAPSSTANTRSRAPCVLMPSWLGPDVLRAVFWPSASLIVYPHAIYPLILRLASRRATGGTHVDPVPESELPSITLLVPCPNEAAGIERNIENLEAL